MGFNGLLPKKTASHNLYNEVEDSQKGEDDHLNSFQCLKYWKEFGSLKPLSYRSGNRIIITCKPL